MRFPSLIKEAKMFIPMRGRSEHFNFDSFKEVVIDEADALNMSNRVKCSISENGKGLDILITSQTEGEFEDTLLFIANCGEFYDDMSYSFSESH